jgi:hypothetical protein
MTGPATAVAATRPTRSGMTYRPAMKADLCCTVCRNEGTYSIATNSTMVAIRNWTALMVKIDERNRYSGVSGSAARRSAAR